MLMIAGGIVIGFLALGLLGGLLELFSHAATWIVLFIVTLIGLVALIPGVGEQVFAIVVASAVMFIPLTIIRTLLGY